VTRIYAVLLLANLAAWAWAVLVFRHQPVLLGTALLAYGFGLRHAVDADHIAAIDNVTRKLMQEGKRPVTVGFFSPWAIRRWSSSWRRPSPRRQIRLRIISTR
jgi:high-affinity nickel permease